MKPIPFPSNTSSWRVEVPGRYFANGKRKAKYFASRVAAEEFIQKLKKYGTAALEQLRRQPQQEAFAIAVHDFAKLYDGKISDAYAAHEKLQKLQNIKPATVREATEAFMTARKAGWSPKGKSPKASTIDADRWRLLKLENRFSRVQLSDLSEVELRIFFDEIKNRNKRSIYKTVHLFFTWAMLYKYVGENPMAQIEPTGKFGINNDYYPVATFKRMLLIASGMEPVKPGRAPTREFLDLLPYFVLSGFLGLRSCEARRENRLAEAIRWTDLHFDAEVPNVEVREEVAKQTARDSDVHWIESSHALEAVKAWLPLAQQKSPFIVPWTKRQIQELKREFTKATGIKFIKNGFRNSFATYGLTFNGLQGVGKLALEMGNSELTCKRHYVKNIAPGSGRAWFNLRPAIGNVIQMPAAAA